MKKRLFNYCKKHLRFVDSGQLKRNATLTLLVEEYNIGFIEGDYFHFDNKDKQRLIEVVAYELNGALLSDDYPNLQPRTQRASTQRNEKQGALKVSEDFVIINSLHSLRLNKKVSHNLPINSLGHFICASEIKTIEHQQIVLVENLIVMANLDRLNIPESLNDALWLYRGDAHATKKTSTAYLLFRRFRSSHQLICFSDADPSGLQICLTSGATQWLTLSDERLLNIELQGDEQEWFKQRSAIGYLNNYRSLPLHCERLFTQMKYTQKTLKQEHMLIHGLTLQLFPLIV